MNTTAYALISPAIDGERPESVNFGFANKLAELVLMWRGWEKERRTQDEVNATVEALMTAEIDLWGYKLVRAETLVMQEAAWTLDFDDVKIYFDGQPTADEYAVRARVASINDNSIRHAMLDCLVAEDKDLDAPGLVASIHAQIDELD